MTDRERWVYRPEPSDSRRIRLFCFPCAGSGAAVYRLWPEEMPDEVEVCRIQLPGRESRLRERPFERLDRLVETLFDVARPYFDLPFAFFGHSMGAQIAFELARKCRRQLSAEPVHLFVAGSRAPGLSNEPHIHRLPEDEFIQAMRSRYGGVPDAVTQNRELLDLVLPLLRADLAVLESHEYVPEQPLDCPISVFGGLDDAWVSCDHLTAWAQHTRGAHTLKMYSGDHFFVGSQRASLISMVSDALDRYPDQP